MDQLPMSVYSPSEKTPSVPDSYLLNFLVPRLKEQLQRLPKSELEKIQDRQKSLQDEIVSFTQKKVSDLSSFAEHVVALHHESNQRQQQEQLQVAATKNSTSDVSTPSVPGTPESSFSSTDSRKRVAKTPLKSSLAKSRSNSDVGNDSDSSGKKSPKRVMFALEEQVAVVPSDYESTDDDDFEEDEEDGDDEDHDHGGDKNNSNASDSGLDHIEEESSNADRRESGQVEEGYFDHQSTNQTNTSQNIFGEQVYLEPEEVEQELSSLSMDGMVPDELTFPIPNKSVSTERAEEVPEPETNKNLEKVMGYKGGSSVVTIDGENDDDDEMFEFDEALQERGGSLSDLEANKGATSDQNKDDEKEEVETEEKELKDIREGLLSPSLGSSLPVSNSSRTVSGSFKPRPVTKYVSEEFDYPHQQLPIDTGVTASSTGRAQDLPQDSTYASSLPIDIVIPPPGTGGSDQNLSVRKRPENLDAVEEETLRQEISTKPESLSKEEEVVDALRWPASQYAALSMDTTEATAAAFGSILSPQSINPARMSLSERMAWEREAGTRNV